MLILQCIRTPLYKGQFQWPQGVCYSAHTITTRGRPRTLSCVSGHLSIRDNFSGPKVPVIQPSVSPLGGDQGYCPVHDNVVTILPRFRTTTIAQRILADVDGKGKKKKKLDPNWDFHKNHSDIHQLNFPDLSPGENGIELDCYLCHGGKILCLYSLIPEDYETDRLYPPTVEREASFMVSVVDSR